MEDLDGPIEPLSELDGGGNDRGRARAGVDGGDDRPTPVSFVKPSHRDLSVGGRLGFPPGWCGGGAREGQLRIGSLFGAGQQGVASGETAMAAATVAAPR